MHVTDSIAALRASCRLVKRLETPLRQLYSVDANMPTLTQNRAPDALKSFGYSNFTSSSYTCSLANTKATRTYPGFRSPETTTCDQLWTLPFKMTSENLCWVRWLRNSCPSDFLPHTSEGHLVDGPLPLYIVFHVRKTSIRDLEIADKFGVSFRTIHPTDFSKYWPLPTSSSA